VFSAIMFNLFGLSAFAGSNTQPRIFRTSSQDAKIDELKIPPHKIHFGRDINETDTKLRMLQAKDQANNAIYGVYFKANVQIPIIWYTFHVDCK
jgi:hypothetical protein